MIPRTRTRHTLDATGVSLGRLATSAATLLIGKHKVTREPHIDGGDFVAITNAKNIRLSGKKIDQKELIHHSWHPGGLKRVPIQRVLNTKPDVVIRHAISKMLPRNKHRAARLKRLTITS